jgi:hypothetical protein
MVGTGYLMGKFIRVGMGKILYTRAYMGNLTGIIFGDGYGYGYGMGLRDGYILVAMGGQR